MRSSSTLLLICLLLASCAVAQPPPNFPDTPTSVPTVSVTASPSIIPTKTSISPTETSTPANVRRKVVLVSWDGGGAEMVYQMMREGNLPNFSLLAAQGVRAEYAQSIDPPMTAAAQSVIASGSHPSHTGIVSNSFHNPNDSIYWYRRGFDEPLDQAEPVWVTASKQGLTTASVFFTGGSPQMPFQMADYTVGYGIQDAASNRFTVAMQPVSQAWEGQAPASYSPALEGSYTIRDVGRVFFLLVDPTDDQKINYSQVWISTERKTEEDTPVLETGQWAALTLLPKIVAGADFLLQEINQDASQVKITLFHSGVFHNNASPRELQEALDDRFGFFPSGSDPYAVEDGWISPEENLYLVKRSAQWMAEVAAWVFQTYQPDLLYAWQDGFDPAGHTYLLQDKRQYKYSPELAQEYHGYFLEAIQTADQALGIILDAVDLETTTLMLVSDHGIAPIHTVVYVNTLLEQAGLLTLDKKDYVVARRTKAFAVASGGAVHIYINLAGHEKDGFVTAEEYEDIQQNIVTLLQDLVDPVSGEKVFQRVLRQDELGKINLDHENSGDVFAQAYPGYHLNGWRGKKYIFEAAPFYGKHGYDSRLPEMHAMFIAAGYGIPPTGGIIPVVSIVDYVPTLAKWLGFLPAPTVDGSPIPALLDKP